MTIKEQINNFNQDSRVEIFKVCKTIKEWNNNMLRFYRDKSYDFNAYLKAISGILEQSETLNSSAEITVRLIKELFEKEI